MDKPDNLTITLLAIASVIIFPLIFVMELKDKVKKKKAATLPQKLYHSLLFSTPDQRGGFESQDRT